MVTPAEAEIVVGFACKRLLKAWDGRSISAVSLLGTFLICFLLMRALNAEVLGSRDVESPLPKPLLNKITLDAST